MYIQKSMKEKEELRR